MENEKHPDPIDQASALEAMETAYQLHRIQSRVKQKQAPLPDGSYATTECVECDAEIGEGRLKHAIDNTVCIYCANERERKTKR